KGGESAHQVRASGQPARRSGAGGSPTRPILAGWAQRAFIGIPRSCIPRFDLEPPARAVWAAEEAVISSRGVASPGRLGAGLPAGARLRRNLVAGERVDLGGALELVEPHSEPVAVRPISLGPREPDHPSGDRTKAGASPA